MTMKHWFLSALNYQLDTCQVLTSSVSQWYFSLTPPHLRNKQKERQGCYNNGIDKNLLRKEGNSRHDTVNNGQQLCLGSTKRKALWHKTQDHRFLVCAWSQARVITSACHK